ARILLALCQKAGKSAPANFLSVARALQVSAAAMPVPLRNTSNPTSTLASRRYAQIPSQQLAPDKRGRPPRHPKCTRGGKIVNGVGQSPRGESERPLSMRAAHAEYGIARPQLRRRAQPQ